MRIVITGASGNVGTALLRRLTAEGSAHDLVGVVRRPPENVGPYESVHWHSVDVAGADAADRLRPVVAGADAIVHLAWGFQPTRNTGYLSRVGVGGTAAILDAAHAESVGRLLHMSSVGTYAAGRYGSRVDESWSTSGIARARACISSEMPCKGNLLYGTPKAFWCMFFKKCEQIEKSREMSI